MASSANPEDRISGLIDYTEFVCLSKRKILLHACMLREILLAFAVEVGTSCFGGKCIGQAGIGTNARPSFLLLENLAFLESNSLDYFQLCIL